MLNPSFPNLLTEDLASLAQSVLTQRLDWRVAEKAGVIVSMRRDDAIHAHLSGNKLYKLHGHIAAYLSSGRRSPIASFGGAYSNHLFALAAAGQMLSIRTIGVIRGERPKQLGPTLLDLQGMGMTLHFVDRARYRQRHDPELLHVLNGELGEECFWVPEGGAGRLGEAGCEELGRACFKHFSPDQDGVITLACGTGATFSGVVNGVASAQSTAVTGSVQVVGVPVLKVGAEYEQEISKSIVDSSVSWELWPDGHCGGYAKFPDYLLQFMVDTEREIGVTLDPVYTAKLMYTLSVAIEAGRFPRGTHILVVHSGGLQGRRGVENKLMELCS